MKTLHVQTIAETGMRKALCTLDGVTGILWSRGQSQVWDFTECAPTARFIAISHPGLDLVQSFSLS